MNRKVIALVMTIAMAFTMMPIMGAPVYADDPAPAAPGIAIGSDVLSIGSNTGGAATVHMADKAWRVIGYGGTGVASSADTMTLLAAGNLKEQVQFYADNEDERANNYYKSNLKTEVGEIANTFSVGEEAGIAARNLEAGGYAELNTDCVAGQAVADEPLWPLSTKEAHYTLNGDLRNINDYWWLRSPGATFRGAAYVRAAGDVDHEGCMVYDKIGVRPAFNYKLNSVIFTSAATGGKSSGTIGADALVQVGNNTNNEWKLTVKNGHDDFKVDSVTTCDKKTLNIEYSDAITGDNEYISAIIKDKDGKVTFYGNLKNCAAEGDASGTVKVKVENKLGADDTLYVFNEQLNGDKKTDFASELKEVTIPESVIHEMTHHDAVSPTCTEDGTVEYWSCGKCNKNFEDEQGTKELTDIVVSKTGHNMTHHDAIPPTCTEDGTVEYWSCGNCNKNFGDEQGNTELTTTVDPKGHKMTHHDAIPPTCTEDGTVEYWSCGNCKKNFGDEQGTKELTTTVDPKGHKMTHHDAVSPTCTEDGTVEYWSCGKCKKNFGDEQGTKELTDIVVSKTGHNMTHHDAIPPTCTEDGTVEYWSCGKCNKNFEDEQGTKELTDIVVSKTGHNMTHHDAIPPTCTEDGTVEYWSCGNCKKNFGDEQGTKELTTTVDPKGHKMTHHDAIPPTCTEDGTVEYWSCGNCKKNFGDEQGTKELTTTVDPKGHKMTHHDAVSPTCTEDGTVEYWSCGKCNKNFEDEQGTKELTDIVVSKTGHNMTHHDAIPPTCTEDGTVEYWSCGNCNKNFGDEQGNKELTTTVNPKTGHQYGEWKKLDANQHQRVCEHDSKHVEKAAHTWDSGKVTKAATEQSEGVKTYTCSVCKATKTDPIPKTGSKQEPGSDPNQKGSDGTAFGKGASAAAAEKAITSMKSDGDPKGTVYSSLKFRSTKQTTKSMTLRWSKVKNAKTYVLYGNKRGKKNKMKKIGTYKKTTLNLKKAAGKKLKKATYYKLILIALDKNNNVVSSSKVIHVATKGSNKKANPTGVTVKAKISKTGKTLKKYTKTSAIALKKGRATKLNAGITKAKKTKVQPHRKVIFESSNAKIAKVTKTGKVKAVRKGTCYIYAYAQDGKAKRIKVKII